MKTIIQIKGLFLSLLCVVLCGSPMSMAQTSTALPSLNQEVSPLDPQNQTLLYSRLVTAYDQLYLQHRKKNETKNLSDDMAFYYLRQELQSLVDMWRATGNLIYLQQARMRVSKAITDAQANLRPLTWHDQNRGEWPCFRFKKVESVTGGHSQLVDFQGATGLLMTATALKIAQQQGANVIGTFVEEKIIAKWVQYNPNINADLLRGPQGFGYLMSMLDSGRDKREHFAVMCMDMHHLGAQGLPYGQFATFLTQLYAGLRTSAQTSSPFVTQLNNLDPPDWGLKLEPDTKSFVWHYKTNRTLPEQVVDTSHGNRTVWLATRGYAESLLPQGMVTGLANTLKHILWKPDQQPFYITNLVDGTDTEIQGLGPGRKGNLWFGWHRLAAYDPDLRDLLISMAYDLTMGGEHFPKNSQNTTMVEARLCYYAWAARLLAPQGQPMLFP